MPDRIGGIKLKIGRAKEHIRDLESVVVPFFDGYPYTYAADLLLPIYCRKFLTTLSAWRR